LDRKRLLKTIRVTLKPLKKQKGWLLKKAQSVPKQLIPRYEKGTYPKGCSRIINNAIQKMWQTCRSAKQIAVDKQISKIVRKNGVLYLKIQKELIPFRVKTVEKLDDLLLNHYNSAVVWLKGSKWVADVQVEVESHYIEGPEAVIGIDLGKWHNCYSIWINGKEIYRAFDKFGKYHFTMRKITRKIGELQRNFEGTRKQLSIALKPLYEKRRMVLRQYYGTLRNKILQHIPEGYNAVFVLEDLDSLPRAELRKTQRTWAHQELANGIFASQIEWNGYKIVKVDARGTTHTCWKCGKPVKSQNDRKIICKTCYPKGLDRDLNGARNIAKRYIPIASAVGTSVSPDANLPKRVDMLSGIGEHSCTPNDRLSLKSHVQTEDNREKLNGKSESNEPNKFG
jgi:transposase